MKYEILSGTHYTMGAIAGKDGVNFAVFSEHATAIELCIYSDDGIKELARLKLPERTGPVWHGFVPGLHAGATYGYRAHGPYNPNEGHRFNSNKLLMDPYARELMGQWSGSNETLGYNERSDEVDLSFDTRDSANAVAKSVVSDQSLWAKIKRQSLLGIAGNDLIYEAHVKGFTQTHPKVPMDVRGTYEGICSKPVIDHLMSLNVSAIELLPVHAFLDDRFLTERGLTNYWGYNTIGFFTPEPRYFGPSGLLGFKRMVQTLQEAGIKVILDVVYNHTAEGDQLGPTLCYRGLDNASYYRLNPDQKRYYVNDTGCGNTLNVSHPYVLKMIMDSLRYWVECMGVDGFRFDLASTLAREDYGFDAESTFLSTLRQDPVLSTVQLIAEPWDIGPGGFQLGNFPHEFSEWNDKYRDAVRKYWRGDAYSGQELASCLLGSAGIFDRLGRNARSSVNFVSSHDGYTLSDITQYNERHNEKNTENNQDGHKSNYSDNGGVEGNTNDRTILARRERRQRNMLATLFLSQGTPMLLAGDEIGNSQDGNNNAYCQDNEVGWLDWSSVDQKLLNFVRHLSSIRSMSTLVQQGHFLHGSMRSSDGKPDVEWSDFSRGTPEWNSPDLSRFCLTVRGSAKSLNIDDTVDSVLLVFNRDDGDTLLMLPIDVSNHSSEASRWYCCLDTAEPELKEPREIVGDSISVEGCSVMALVLKKEI